MLDPRERIVVIAGAAGAALILVVSFVVIPASSRLSALTRSSAAAERDLAEIRRLRPELERLEKEVRPRAAKVAAGGTGESPAARLAASIQEGGFGQSSVSVRSAGSKEGEFYAEEAFDVRVENVTYLEAVKLLARLETGPLPLAVRTAKLKSRFDDSRYLDVSLRVGYLKPARR